MRLLSLIVVLVGFCLTNAFAEFLEIEDIKIGTGPEAVPGDQVRVHYTGWLLNGTKFDSSLDRREPFTFKLGVREVIEGWDRGVRGMQIGGTRKLIIPPELAYGDRPVGGGLIPANSTIILLLPCFWMVGSDTPN